MCMACLQVLLAEGESADFSFLRLLRLVRIMRIATTLRRFLGAREHHAGGPHANGEGGAQTLEHARPVHAHTCASS